MSAYGYADGQAITGWLGVPLVDTTGLALGAGSHTDGPFIVTNFASVIVAIKATGGPVTLKVKQAISGGPASLVLEEDLVVTAGETVFQSFVLFGDSVSVELDGSVGGTTVDYAVVPSNTTTNAQVIQAATINVQHNDALVGTEQTLDFEDGNGLTWVIADDGPNQRVKITPSGLALVPIGDVVVGAGGAATIDFSSIPQAYKHLLLELSLRSNAGPAADFILGHFNADVGAVYDNMGIAFSGAGGIGPFVDEALSARLIFGLCPAGGSAAGAFGSSRVEIPDYADAAIAKTHHYSGWHIEGARAIGNARYIVGGGDYNPGVGAGVNRITMLPNTGTLFVQSSRATLYGYN